MVNERIKYLEQVRKANEKAAKMTSHYWESYSNLHTWQFWIQLGLLIFPLIILYLFIDRRKVFLIGFFGFNVHIWFHYLDTYGIMNGLWIYPYSAIPFLNGFALDVSLIPVFFMLVYQWTLNNNKNYYLYAAGLCAFLAFLFKPAMVTFGFFRIYKGMNYLYIFLIYILVMLMAKWITNIFLYLHNKQGTSGNQKTNFNRLFRKKEGES